MGQFWVLILLDPTWCQGHFFRVTIVARDHAMTKWENNKHTHTQKHTWPIFSVKAVMSSYQYWRDHMPSLITINLSKWLLALLCLSTAAVARPFYLPPGHINISLPSFLPLFNSFIYNHLTACSFSPFSLLFCHLCPFFSQLIAPSVHASASPFTLFPLEEMHHKYVSHGDDYSNVHKGSI